MKKRDLLYWAIIGTLVLVCNSLWEENQRRGVVSVIDTDSMYVAPTASESKGVGTWTVSVPKIGVGVPKMEINVPKSARNVLEREINVPKSARNVLEREIFVSEGETDTEAQDTTDAVEAISIREEGDSIKVEIPVTQKVYRDSSYTAWVSGYRASLDSIKVRERTVIIAEKGEKRKPKVTVGLTGGAGLVGLRGETGLGWFVGLGVTVPLWGW